ncbi:hypothetical protein PBRA_001107 [Plasmodiophora brassicae]|nr:hypothetical protein PBRA_001107 [Plasmodiophora brassicae]
MVISNAQDVDGTVPVDTQHDGNQDRFGIEQLFASVDESGDWYANWDGRRVVDKAFQEDPADSRCVSRGTGPFEIGNGELVMNGTAPRFYITAPSTGWMNTETTVYGMAEGWGPNNIASITIISRTRHNRFRADPCEARAYYARVFLDNGAVQIKKEFRHDSNGTIIYSSAIPAKRRFKTFDFRSRYFGLKFVVRTNQDGLSVNLRVYCDATDGANGGTWDLVLDYDDVDLAALSRTGCKYPDAVDPFANDDSPILRSGETSVIRSDDVYRLHVKRASVREINPVME